MPREKPREAQRPKAGDSERGASWESPVTFIGVEGLIAGFVATDSLHEVVHGFC